MSVALLSSDNTRPATAQLSSFTQTFVTVYGCYMLTPKPLPLNYPENFDLTSLGSLIALILWTLFLWLEVLVLLDSPSMRTARFQKLSIYCNTKHVQFCHFKNTFNTYIKIHLNWSWTFWKKCEEKWEHIKKRNKDYIGQNQTEHFLNWLELIPTSFLSHLLLPSVCLWERRTCMSSSHQLLLVQHDLFTTYVTDCSIPYGDYKCIFVFMCFSSSVFCVMLVFFPLSCALSVFPLSSTWSPVCSTSSLPDHSPSLPALPSLNVQLLL